MLSLDNVWTRLIAAWVPLCGVLGAGQRENHSTLCRPRNKKSLQEKLKRRQSAKQEGNEQNQPIFAQLALLYFFTFLVPKRFVKQVPIVTLPSIREQ